MKAAIGSGVGKMVGAYIGGTSLAKVCHGSVQLWPDDLWQVSVLRFASDVRTAAMTHALWRGSISTDIGGVSYVHGRNMQIADDGMSLEFTGEDKPTYREVKAALGESMVLNATLRGNQQDVGVTSRVYERVWEYVSDLPIAPCLVGSYVHASRHGAEYYVDVYENYVSSDYHKFAYTWSAYGANWDYEEWIDSPDWGTFGSKMIVRYTISTKITWVSWITVRFKEFSYAKQYNVIGIE